MNLSSILQQRADIWRGGGVSPSDAPHCPTGHAELDERLGGGWPLGALTEILTDREGIGELRLLLPALAALPPSRWQTWVGPPHTPYAPALAAAGIDLSRFIWVHAPSAADALWALEQSLRSGACAAVLGWPKAAQGRDLRRLQLAAEHGGASGFLFRPRREARSPSPAALRLELEHSPAGLTIHVIKRRGGWNGRPLVLAA